MNFIFCACGGTSIPHNNNNIILPSLQCLCYNCDWSICKYDV